MYPQSLSEGTILKNFIVLSGWETCNQVPSIDATLSALLFAEILMIQD